MKNYRTSDFDQVEKKDVRKSLFDLSHEIKTQMCFGRYYPIHWEECYPLDSFSLDFELMARFPATYLPLQQLGTFRCDVMYAPYSILFRGEMNDNYNKLGWKGFIMGEDVELPLARLNLNGNIPDGYSTFYPGCSYPIENYMGFPMDLTDRIDSSKQWSIWGTAFPLAMYLMCYDEYYRNPLWEEPSFFNLISGNNDDFELVKQIVDGQELVSWQSTAVGVLGDVFVNHAPFFAHYMKDYFTASRPEPQDGDPIKIPLVNDQYGPGEIGAYGPYKWVAADDGSSPGSGDLVTDANGDSQVGSTPVSLDIQDTASDIRQLRIANILQQFQERVMRFGKRYGDWIKGLFGNKPEASVIDIPVLIGSWVGRLQISDTMTTADTSESFTGNYRGNINLHNNGTNFRYRCEDYGIMIWIINIMPNTGYSQGIHPKWTREVAHDYPLDMFSGIGDQEIKRKELLALNIKALWDHPDDHASSPNATIGYNDRFAEVKTAYNRFFNTKELYKSWYMGQIIGSDEPDYDEVTAGRVITASSYSTSDGIRERDIFNVLPIKSGNSTYTDATIFAHFLLTIKVERCLPFFSIPGKQIF